jgi:hypothetical protein
VKSDFNQNKIQNYQATTRMKKNSEGQNVAELPKTIAKKELAMSKGQRSSHCYFLSY